MKTNIILILSLFLLSCGNREAVKLQTINVLGESEIKAKPDIAVLNFYVLLNSSNKEKVIQDLNTITNKIYADVKKLGIDSNSVFADDLNVDWYYRYDSKGNIIGTKYSASENIKVKADFSKHNIEGIINTVKKISKIDFSIDFELSKAKEDSIKSELIKLAIKDADKKAKTIADEKSLEIYATENINYHVKNDKVYPPPYLANSYDWEVMKNEEEKELKLNPENVILSDNIEVLYSVKGK